MKIKYSSGYHGPTSCAIEPSYPSKFTERPFNEVSCMRDGKSGKPKILP